MVIVTGNGELYRLSCLDRRLHALNRGPFREGDSLVPFARQPGGTYALLLMPQVMTPGTRGCGGRFI